MSLWTPGGEIPIERDRGRGPSPEAEPSGIPGGPGGPSLEDLSPEERERAEQMIAEMAEVQRQIVAAPAAQLVVNHIVGFYELAAIHLGQEHPRLDDARLAIDAMAATLDGVGDRLGEEGASLREALTQLQMAFVQRQGEATAG